MPMLSPTTDRFGAWGGGPLTGTVTRPPPSAGPSAPPSATAGGYIPQASAALPADTGSDSGSGGDSIGDDFGGNTSSPQWGGGPGDFGNGTGAGIDGGAGLSGGGGHGPSMGGSMAFDDGGEVDDGDGDEGGSEGGMAPTGDQNSQSTVDPMSIIKQALSFGRQSMGLPQNFSNPQQGNQGSVSGQAHRLVQPNAADQEPGSYLRPQSGQGFQGPSGNDLGNTNMAQNGGQDDQTASLEDGGEIPDPSQSQGQPQDQMGAGSQLPDPRKTISYLAGAGGVQPEIADALEQHIDPQGQMEPAERTLKAIMAAPTPEAQFGLMQHYRTRANAYSGAARAALDQGNMAQAAQHATAAFANIPTGYNVKFAPARGGLAVQASKIGAGQQGAQQGPQQSMSDGGAVDADNPAVMMKSYDDGGEVTDDDDDDQGVLPTSPDEQEGDTSSDQASEPVAVAPETAGDDAGMTQPVMLSSAQVHNMLKAGSDQPLDEGWGGFLSKILSSVNPMGSAQAAPAGQQQGQGTVSGSPDVDAALQAGQPQQPQGGMSQQMQNPKGDRQPVQPQPQPQPQQQQPQSQPKDNVGDRIANAKRMADAAFPEGGVAMSPEKRAYYSKLLQGEQTNAARLDQTNAMWGNRSQIEQGKEQGRNDRNANSEQHRDDRSANSVGERLQAAQLGAITKLTIADQTTLFRGIVSRLNNMDPKTDPNAVMQQLAPIAQKLNMQPPDLLRWVQQGGPQQGGGQQPQGGQPQGGQDRSQEVGTVKSGPHAGKAVVRDPNTGAWVLAPGQK